MEKTNRTIKLSEWHPNNQDKFARDALDKIDALTQENEALKADIKVLLAEVRKHYISGAK